MSALPWDVERDILSRLAVKSVVRFSSACKRWRISIDDILAQQASLGNNSRILLYSWKLQDMAKGTASLLSIDYKRLMKSRDFEHEIKQVSIPTTENICDSFMKIVGSCNGLVCLLINRSFPRRTDIVLWNPLTRIDEKLPHPSNSDEFSSINPAVCGFGYDISTGDYKVIASHAYRSHQVYSLKTNNWMTLDPNAVPQRFMLFNPFRPHDMIPLNGSLHWYISNKSAELPAGSDVILAFDLAGEKFWDLPLADSIVSSISTTCAHRLANLDGRLCFYSTTCNFDSSSKTMIWVMKEYGVKESWMSWITVTSDYNMREFQPLCMSQNEEIVALIDCGLMRKLVTYDPTQQGMYKVVKYCNSVCYYGVVHEESVVSPIPTKPSIGGFRLDSSLGLYSEQW